MSGTNNVLEVFREDKDGPMLVGQAFFTRRRRSVSTTFVYDSGFLASGNIAIDPSLPLVSGAQHYPGLVGAFGDSAPDRWGRNLINKAMRAGHAENLQAVRELDELDYFLGVSDNTRQGALRFRWQGTENFLGADSSVPPLMELPALLEAARSVVNDDEPLHAVKLLLDTGSTGLGGARPKAAVRLDDGALGLAKFPHSADEWDVMAWEATALDLLEASGVSVPQRRLVSVGNRHVLIVRRFDRDEAGNRFGYISAMTATGSSDGERLDYLDVLDALRDLAAAPDAQARELFVRVVVSVALGNTDDHLRNHGFLERERGWELSPVFDVNPRPELAQPRETSILGEDQFPAEVGVLREFGALCGIEGAAFEAIISTVVEAVSQWEARASGHGIRLRDRDLMRTALDARVLALRDVLRS